MRERLRRAETLIRIQKERMPHLFVGGLEVESEANATIVVTNPGTGEAIGRCPAANTKDVDKAAETARKAFEDGWGASHPSERAKYLLALADAIEHEAEDIAILESLQTGKTYRDVLQQDVHRSAQLLRHYAGWAGKFPGETHELGRNLSGSVRTEAYPVIAAVLHWSRPFASAVSKLGTALALGSTVILQPPEQAPLTVLKLGEMAREIGLPAGVMSVLTGLGNGAGVALANHPGVDALSYAGSIENSRRMLLGAAKSNLKPVHLELGDKTPLIMFEDADRNAALAAVCNSIFTSRCTLPTAASRLLVHERHYEQVATLLAARAKEALVGDPLDEHTELGPMIDEAHLEKVLAYTELGRREGAKLVAGGRRDTEGKKSRGSFFKPSVFLDVRPDMRIATEEIAGPVLVVLPFKSEDEAVMIANGTDYGLAASVWTKDLARAQRMTTKLQSGLTWINSFDVFDPALPVGGTKLSGHGQDMGRAALQQLSRTRTVYINQT